MTHADTLDGVSALQSVCAYYYQRGQTGPGMVERQQGWQHTATSTASTF